MTMESGSSAQTNGSAEQLGISRELLSILVCPVDHGTLSVGDGVLICTVCERAYTVEDGIPNMVTAADLEGER